MANHKKRGRYPDGRVTEDGLLILDIPNDQGHRIHEVWLFVSRDQDGDEGICAFMGPYGWMPMVASDTRRRDLLRQKAKEMARAEPGKKIVVRHFTSWQDVEEIKR